jgi:hypothetical protein
MRLAARFVTSISSVFFPARSHFAYGDLKRRAPERARILAIDSDARGFADAAKIEQPIIALARVAARIQFCNSRYRQSVSPRDPPASSTTPILSYRNSMAKQGRLQ